MQTPPHLLRTLLLAGAILLAGCASFPSGALEEGVSSVEVPARFHGSHVTVPVHLAESGEVWLLLDSGSQMTILDASAARALGVEFGGESTLSGIGQDTLGGGITSGGVSIRVPGTEAYVLQRPVADLAPIWSAAGTRLGGILGADLFFRFVVEIDYARERVIVHDPRRFQPGPEDVRLPLEIHRALPYVHGRIMLPDGREVDGRFLVDTGSNTTLTLNSAFVSTHGIMAAVPSTIGSETMGIGGVGTRRQARLGSFQLGPFMLDEPVVSLSTVEAGASTVEDGHIGSGVLRRFSVTVDYRRGALYLRPGPAVAEPFEADMAGFALFARSMVVPPATSACRNSMRCVEARRDGWWSSWSDARARSTPSRSGWNVASERATHQETGHECNGLRHGHRWMRDSGDRRPSTTSIALKKSPRSKVAHDPRTAEPVTVGRAARLGPVAALRGE